jgi:hypothetical protein
MKKFILPIIALTLDISLYFIRPDLILYRRLFQLMLYTSLVRILVFKTTNNTPETILLKWALCIGPILPIFLISTSGLMMGIFYIADAVLLIPILYYEIVGKGGEIKQGNLQMAKMKDYKGWEIIKIALLVVLSFMFIAFGVYSARENYGIISMFCGIFGAHAANSLHTHLKNRKGNPTGEQ